MTDVVPAPDQAVGSDLDRELEREQAYVTTLYDRLDTVRAETRGRLDSTRRTRAEGTHQSRSERDAFAAAYESRLAQLEAVEERLVFGRLDHRDGARHYVGRIGLSDPDQTQLLLDWRAPAARHFYQATAAEPGTVVRRRHLTTRDRRVTHLEDEALDLGALDGEDLVGLSGEGALIAALGAERTGRMHDIVATIQAEQDRIIRSEMRGTLVVQGGPGTGKTAVALHRAAYLLYTFRRRLAGSGMLLVGPSEVFLHYIEQVLPSLGETDVVMATPGRLFPGVDAETDDPPEVAAVKGDLRMAKVIARAIGLRQRVPDAPLVFDLDGRRLVLQPDVVAAARHRHARRPHNIARNRVLTELLDHLALQYARLIGAGTGDVDVPSLRAEIGAYRDVRRELNLLWMPLEATQVLADLYADPGYLAAAAPGLSPRERQLLLRPRGSAWTVSDVPLLDEAAELLGVDDTEARRERARARAQREQEVAYARESLRGSAAAAMVTAEQLADRFADDGPWLSVAERAAGDRTWTYGHVVVDEAQELSPMMWRLVTRRCPSRSMTVVGDVMQTGSVSGSRTWAATLDRHARDRWRLEELTVNYRTPATVMDRAVTTVRAAGLDVTPPTSVRDLPDAYGATRVRATDASSVAGAVAGVRGRHPQGTVAVVLPRGRDPQPVADALGGLLVEPVGVGPTALDRPVCVLTVEQVKGLEFDTVVVVEPADVLAGGARGAGDLYVALTRPTRHLHVVHAEPLPPGLG